MKSNITCADLGLTATKEIQCLAEDAGCRCIDVPPNVCRMKPIDDATGKKLMRKFTVKKENVEAKWW